MFQLVGKLIKLFELFFEKKIVFPMNLTANQLDLGVAKPISFLMRINKERYLGDFAIQVPQ